MSITDPDWVATQKSEEALNKILTELKSPYAVREWDIARRESYESRWATFDERMTKLKLGELAEKEYEWRGDLKSILTNFEVLDKHLETGEINLDQAVEFINNLGEHSYITQSKTLRKLFKEYKQKIEDYSNTYKKNKVKKTKKKKRKSNSS